VKLKLTFELVDYRLSKLTFWLAMPSTGNRLKCEKVRANYKCFALFLDVDRPI